MTNWRNIAEQIKRASGLQINHKHIQRVGGGCINAAYLLGDDSQRVFVKINQSTLHDMFQAEAAGLREMKQARAVQIPEVYCVGQDDNIAFIAMQAYVIGRAQKPSYRNFGIQLARMHGLQKSRFGAYCDNTIGSTPQPNRWMDSWFDFWREQRLGFQLELAKNNRAPGALIEDGYILSEKMEQLFDAPPAAACLHGDLWNGNWAFDQNGQPLIFDPAHYFGDRETDIAMTTLFGRAHPDFYAAYHDTYPLSDNYAARETFYNIYHILNHFNLFGGGYAQQAYQMIQKTLSELN